jgi:hypothetical protein
MSNASSPVHYARADPTGQRERGVELPALCLSSRSRQNLDISPANSRSAFCLPVPFSTDMAVRGQVGLSLWLGRLSHPRSSA